MIVPMIYPMGSVLRDLTPTSVRRSVGCLLVAIVATCAASNVAVPLRAAAITRTFQVQPASEPGLLMGTGLAGNFLYDVDGTLALTWDREAGTATIAADNTHREFAAGPYTPSWSANTGSSKNTYLLHVFQQLGTVGRWINDSTIRFEQCATLPIDIDRGEMVPVVCTAIGVNASGDDVHNPLFGMHFLGDLTLQGDSVEFVGRSDTPHVFDGGSSSLHFTATAVAVPETHSSVSLMLLGLLSAWQCRVARRIA